MQNAHPVIKAMVAVMIHLIGFTTMLHERLRYDGRGGGFAYGHPIDLGTNGFIASAKLGKRTFCSKNFKLSLVSYFFIPTYMVGTTGFLSLLFIVKYHIPCLIIYMQIVI